MTVDPRKAPGKWGDPTVPKRGWQWVGGYEWDEEQEQRVFICEMCEHQEIRWVHVMDHPAYGRGLDVGCVCARKMEGNPAAAKRREIKAKSLAKRRDKFVSGTWRTSRLGNEYVNRDGFNFVVYRHGNGTYGGRITRRATGEAGAMDGGPYTTPEAMRGVSCSI